MANVYVLVLNENVFISFFYLFISFAVPLWCTGLHAWLGCGRSWVLSPMESIQRL